MKKTIQLGVRISEADLQLFRKAADLKWPDAELTNSAILLTLAKIAAREIVGKKKK